MTRGQVQCDVTTQKVGGPKFQITAQVMELPTGVAAILGTPFLNQSKAVIDFHKEIITFTDEFFKKGRVPFEPLIERSMTS